MQYAIDLTLQSLGTPHNYIQDTEAAESLEFNDFDDFQVNHISVIFVKN